MASRLFHLFERPLRRFFLFFELLMASRFFVKAFSALNKWCNTDNTVARIAVNGNFRFFCRTIEHTTFLNLLLARLDLVRGKFCLLNICVSQKNPHQVALRVHVIYYYNFTCQKKRAIRAHFFVFILKGNIKECSCIWTYLVAINKMHCLMQKMNWHF